MKVYIFELDKQEVNDILKSGRTVVDFLSGGVCDPPSSTVTKVAVELDESDESDFSAMADDLFGSAMPLTHTDSGGRTVKVTDKAAEKAKRISNTLPSKSTPAF